jgi:hypothetical protein
MNMTVAEQSGGIVQPAPCADGGVATVELERDGLWSPGSDDRLIELCVCRGTLWATIPESLTDILLTEGERRQLRTSGLLVQSLGSARFQTRWL